MPHSVNSLLKALSGSVSASYRASSWSSVGGAGGAGTGFGAGAATTGAAVAAGALDNSSGSRITALATAATAAPEYAAHGSHAGWMLLPNTSPAARRTTLALTR